MLKDTAMQTDGNWSEMAAEKLRQEKKKKRRAASAKESWFFQCRSPLCRFVAHFVGWWFEVSIVELSLYKCNGFQK